MARSVISTNTALLCLFATLGVQALAPLAKPDPTCTTRNIPDAIASISSNNPHPTLFCSAYLHIPPNVHTTTRTYESSVAVACPRLLTARLVIDRRLLYTQACRQLPHTRIHLPRPLSRLSILLTRGYRSLTILQTRAQHSMCLWQPEPSTTCQASFQAIGGLISMLVHLHC